MTSSPSDLELIRCSPTNGCGQLKPRSRMARYRTSDPLCMACYQRARRSDQSPAEVRRANLWAKYRITPEGYDALRAKQDYRCGICSVKEADVDLIRADLECLAQAVVSCLHPPFSLQSAAQLLDWEAATPDTQFVTIRGGQNMSTAPPLGDLSTSRQSQTISEHWLVAWARSLPQVTSCGSGAVQLASMLRLAGGLLPLRQQMTLICH